MFLRHGLRPPVKVQTRLGLVGLLNHKAFMDMWVVSSRFVAGSKSSDRHLWYVWLAVGVGDSLTAVQCIEPVDKKGRQLGTLLQFQKT